MKLPSQLLFCLVGSTLGVSCLAANSAMPPEVELQLIGISTIPTGTTVDGVLIEELSGITYDRFTDTFFAVNDSGGAGNARLFSFDFRYAAGGVDGVAPLGSQQLLMPNGGLLPSVDAEGVALGQNGQFYISTEGRGSGNPPAITRDPWVWEFDASTMRQTAVLPVPEKFLPRDSGGNPVASGHDAQATGVRQNLGFEGLGLCPTERYVYTATEAALLQDDSRSPFDGEFNQAHNSDSRILRFHRDSAGNWQAGPEKVYRSDQGTTYLFVVRRFNTVPSILPIDDQGRMLVMERGLTANNLNTGSYRIRIYEIDFNQPNATDVSPYSSLLNLPTPLVLNRLSKRLVWQSSSGMDNIEGMAWGRDLNGYRSLVLVSDNNNSTNQITQFVALQSNIPAPVRIDVEVVGAGQVDSDPQLTYYLPGTVVDLQAQPEANHVFINWSGDVSETSSSLTVLPQPGANILLNALFGTPFQRWLRDFYDEQEIQNQGLENPASAPMNDGIPNLLKYALGLSPLKVVRGPLVQINPQSLSGEFPVFEFRLPDPPPPDVNYKLLISQDLVSDWQEYLLFTLPGVEIIPQGDQRNLVRVPSPLAVGDAPRQFMKLKVEVD